MELKRFTKTTPTGESIVCYNMTGAGTADVNGTYVRNGSYNGYAMYQKDGVTVYHLKSYSSSYFAPQIYKSDGTEMYYQDDSYPTDTPDTITLSRAADAASEPSPSAAKGAYPSGNAETLFTVASNKTDTIIAVLIQGNSDSGDITLSRTLSDSSTYFTQKIHVSKNDAIVLDHKSVMQSGDSYKIASASQGIQVVVSLALK